MSLFLLLNWNKWIPTNKLNIKLLINALLSFKDFAMEMINSSYKRDVANSTHNMRFNPTANFLKGHLTDYRGNGPS